MARPKKIHRFKVVTFLNRGGTTAWRVTGTLVNGRQVRLNFQTKPEAVQRMAELEMEAEGAAPAQQTVKTALSEDQVADAEAAFRLFTDGGNLANALSHYQSLNSRARKLGVELDQAMAFVENHYRPETKTITVLNATREFLSTRRGITETTLANYEIGLRLLLKRDPNKPVHSFTVGDIEAVLARYTNVRSQRSFRRIFSVFFHWAVRHHYCLEDPCKRLDRLPKDMTRIEVLSLDEVKRLLTAAVRHQDGAAAASIAIGLFAGLRPSELADLKPEDIANGKMRVTGGKLRRTLKRVVPVPPVLVEWLKVHPFTGLPKGWQSKLKTLEKATSAAAWVQDIIRHTSITFQAERDRNEALTAFNNGTSKAMMDRHYRDLIGDDKVIAE
ncbi:MAG: hypothetical protein J0M04_20900, partial [Verrucomicrobia bacterium]|nr:hypothetical protein [Verrucomicrobiota bacterium]